MKLLIKSVKILDKNSPHHQTVVDLVIEHGTITKIGEFNNLEGFETLEYNNAHASIGWFDMRSFLGEPGKEHLETLDSLEKASSNGGFTEAAVLPNTEPPVHSREMVENIVLKTNHRLLKLHSFAAITRNFDGSNLTEMVDLKNAGAVAFTDVKPIESSNTLQLALQYTQPFNGIVINVPLDQAMSAHKMVGEGEISTRLGLPGIPKEAEELMIDRDLNILRYANGRLHFSLVNTKKGIEKIKAAKEEGLNVTCDTAAYYLHLNDENLTSFDSSYKVFPPLREESDVEALKKAVELGVIDVIVSGHEPLNPELKDLEFDRAEYGISGQDNTFQLLNEVVELDVLLEKIAYGPRKILDLPCPVIKEGEKANITFFDPDHSRVWNRSDFKSKGKNSPFIGKELKGKVYGVVHNNQYQFNSDNV